MNKGTLTTEKKGKGDAPGAKKILTTRDVVTPAAKPTGKPAMIITTRDVRKK